MVMITPVGFSSVGRNCPIYDGNISENFRNLPSYCVLHLKYEESSYIGYTAVSGIRFRDRAGGIVDIDERYFHVGVFRLNHGNCYHILFNMKEHIPYSIIKCTGIPKKNT